MTFLYWIPSAICAGSAAYMALNGVTGWGWFLFVAVLTYPRTFLSVGDKDDNP